MRLFHIASFAVLAVLPAAPAAARSVSQAERLEYVKRGRVWRPVNVASMDLLNGPQGDGAYKFREEVRCTYEERDPSKIIGGHSKKFPCHDAGGARLKIKYDPKSNTEVFGEVAGARLFWALGFPAERMYSVKVLCQNCPADPFVSADPPRSTRGFEPATIQKRLEGEQIAEGEGEEGWMFHELDLIDEAAGGSPKAHVDALKLLTVFVNHGDNTPNQQRILCEKDDPGCKKPWVYVTDLGGTFGGKGFYTSFRNWSKRRIWKDAAACVADFRGTTPEFRDPKISEAGRQHLADLLGALSQKQIRDLFISARFDVLGGIELPVAGKDGRSHKVTVDDWVRVFLEKRDQILKARCPS